MIPCFVILCYRRNLTQRVLLHQFLITTFHFIIKLLSVMRVLVALFLIWGRILGGEYSRMKKQKKKSTRTRSRWPEVSQKLFLVEGWARDGLSCDQIANNLGISSSTVDYYKKTYPEFKVAITKGKEVANYEVENALFKAAIAGNITAQIFWLKNCKPEKWRETIKHDVTTSAKTNEAIDAVIEGVMISEVETEEEAS